MNKGTELPVNVIVILSLAVIVLLALVSFFVRGFNTGSIDDSVVMNSCCSSVVTSGHCDESNWDSSLEGLEGCDEGGGVCVEISGQEHSCSEYIPSPSDCPSCQN